MAWQSSGQGHGQATAERAVAPVQSLWACTGRGMRVGMVCLAVAACAAAFGSLFSPALDLLSPADVSGPISNGSCLCQRGDDAQHVRNWPLFRMQWEQALRELQLPEERAVGLKEYVVGMMKKDRHHQRGFYNAYHGTSLYSGCGTALAYVRQYKGANNLFRRTLAQWETDCASEGKSRSTAPADAATWSRSHPLAFSFVREPMEHFISGWSEVAFRAQRGGHPQYAVEEGRYAFVNRSRDLQDAAKGFIEDTLLGRLWRTRDKTDAHVFAQIGPLRHVRRVGFIGRLESTDADWLALGQAAGAALPHLAEDRSHPETSASAEPPARVAMARVIRDSLPHRRALCRILSPDYVCLGYRLPSGCDDVLDVWRDAACVGSARKG